MFQSASVFRSDSCDPFLRDIHYPFCHVPPLYGRHEDVFFVEERKALLADLAADLSKGWLCDNGLRADRCPGGFSMCYDCTNVALAQVDGYGKDDYEVIDAVSNLCRKLEEWERILSGLSFLLDDCVSSITGCEHATDLPPRLP